MSLLIAYYCPKEEFPGYIPSNAAISGSTLQLEKNLKTENTELLPSIVKKEKYRKKICLLPVLFILYSKLRKETLCFLDTYCIFSTSWVQNTEQMFHIGVRLI